MSNIFMTADTHLGHDSIRRHCNRPWKTVEEMDEALIARWNFVVGKKDQVYVLGDFAMYKKIPGVDSMTQYRRAFQQLNGKKFLIKGNHDSMSREVYRECFSEVYDGILDKTIDHQRVTLCHYPMVSWNASYHGSWSLHGHTHNRLKEVENVLRLDVGVDNPEWNYTPVPWDILRTKMSTKYTKWCEYNKNPQHKI
jgi:calcineurin-like phosphoesterase family protein